MSHGWGALFFAFPLVASPWWSITPSPALSRRASWPTLTLRRPERERKTPGLGCGVCGAGATRRFARGTSRRSRPCPRRRQQRPGRRPRSGRAPHAGGCVRVGQRPAAGARDRDARVLVHVVRGHHRVQADDGAGGRRGAAAAGGRRAAGAGSADWCGACRGRSGAGTAGRWEKWCGCTG